MIERSKAPASPCVNVCVMGDRKTCTGCFRTSSEIARWPNAPVEEQWQIVAAAAARRSGCDD